MKHTPHHRLAAPASQRGAALLMALMIVTLVSTLAASMVWQQWRAVQVETAERLRVQSAWLLTGALDWTRVILKEDAKGDARSSSGAVDHLGEPWAVPLAEARISTFLAIDKDNTDEAPDTFLSGSIVDAQSRYNLRNLVGADGMPKKEELETLKRLCTSLNISNGVADRLAMGLRDAIVQDLSPPPPSANPNPPLMPQRIDQLAWVGLDAESLKRLEPYIALLPPSPNPTPVNVNTASREVISAVLGIDLGTAERLVQMRGRAPFRTLLELQTQLPGVTLAPERVSQSSNYFIVTGRLRLANQVLEQRSLIERRGTVVTPLTREWINSNDPG